MLRDPGQSDWPKNMLPILSLSRRHLHAHPELSYLAFNTSAFVQQMPLTAMDIPFKKMATTGVVGLIKGKNPDKRVIALRADMDALPIKEENKIDYISQNDGVMHACGHDVHTTVLLGAAKYTASSERRVGGHRETGIPARRRTQSRRRQHYDQRGSAGNPRPQAISLGLHVHWGLPIGRLSFRGGKVMASADELYITIRSKGGHAAAPHLYGRYHPDCLAANRCAATDHQPQPQPS